MSTKEWTSIELQGEDNWQISFFDINIKTDTSNTNNRNLKIIDE